MLGVRRHQSLVAKTLFRGVAIKYLGFGILDGFVLNLLLFSFSLGFLMVKNSFGGLNP